MQRIFLVVACAALLGACGGGSRSDGVRVQTPEGTFERDSCSPGGIWRADDGAVLIVDESPRGHLVLPDGAQVFGKLIGVGSNTCELARLESQLQLALPVGSSLPDGSVTARGMPDESDWAKRRGDFQLTANLGTAAGRSMPVRFRGHYDSQHRDGSAHSTVMGSYRPVADGDVEVLTIDSAGRVFSQNSRSGCIINGSFDPVDDRYNVYQLAITYSGCQGPEAALNGWPGRGLGTFDRSKTPAELWAPVVITTDVRHLSVVLRMRRI